MAHPYFHALSSCRRWGGSVHDYVGLHGWFDSTKAHVADARHRLILHNQGGIELLVSTFGAQQVNSSGTVYPLYELGIQHVTEDFGYIPEVGLVVEKLAELKLPRYNPERARDAAAALRLERAALEPLHSFFAHFYSRTPEDHPHRHLAYALLANSFGIFLAERKFGVMFEVAGRDRPLPTRLLAERIVQMGFGGYIPPAAQVIGALPNEKWMFVNAAALDQQFSDREAAEGFIDPIVEAHRQAIKERNDGLKTTV